MQRGAANSSPERATTANTASSAVSRSTTRTMMVFSSLHPSLASFTTRSHQIRVIETCLSCLLPDHDDSVVQPFLSDEVEQDRSMLRVQPNATGRSWSTEAVRLIGAMDRVVAVVKD